MVADSYLTIEVPSEGEYKEKGSKFLAYAFPMENEIDLDLYMEGVKIQHPKARHYCYAYKIGMDGNKFRTNDDGEPSGTAGKPIFGQILSFKLTNIGIIVVRYFGGTKLGATGLIHAYKEAAKESLHAAVILEKYIYCFFQLQFGYEHMGHVMNAIKEVDAEILNKDFENQCNVILGIRLSQNEAIIHKLKAKLLSKSMDEVTAETEVPFCKVKRISENTP